MVDPPPGPGNRARLPEAKRRDCRHEARRACGIGEDHGKLLLDGRVLASRCGDQVQDAFPNLVQAVQPGPVPPRQDFVEPG